jgi:hypothetical protein
MSRHSPRSEGHCSAYKRDASSETAHMAIWRARLHNEHTGMPKTDVSGANTSLSLVWNPSSKEGNYTLRSHRRVSQLKQVQDFGVAAIAAPPPPAMPPTVAARSRAYRVQELEQEAPAPRDFLDGETARLKACAHARNIGQTFLTSGNLAQAKAYLERAEQILKVTALGTRRGGGMRVRVEAPPGRARALSPCAVLTVLLVPCSAWHCSFRSTRSTCAANLPRTSSTSSCP